MLVIDTTIAIFLYTSKVMFSYISQISFIRPQKPMFVATQSV